MASSLVLCVLVLLCFSNGSNVAGATDDAESCIAGYDYRDALSKAILFFEGQRSGKLPANQRVEWRGDSALSDGKLENVNLTGGYYDAGDNVKFVWPMAFSVTLLSWAAVERHREISSINLLADIRSAIEWGTGFLLKAHHSSTTFYTQVATLFPRSL